VNRLAATCDEIVDYEECVKFDKKQSEYTTDTLSFRSGTLAEFDDPNDPLPVYNRGLWFNGVSYMEIGGLVLSHTFTIEMWIRPSGGETIFSSNKNLAEFPGDEDHLSYGINSTAFTLVVTKDRDTEYLSAVSDAPYEQRAWMNVAFTFEWVNGTTMKTYTNLFLNGNPVGSH
jgi:hypothetical protein